MRIINLSASIIILLLTIPVILIWFVLLVFIEYGEALKRGIQRHNLKYTLWLLGLYEPCPYCGGEIIKHGFEPDERYTCVIKECKFNN